MVSLKIKSKDQAQLVSSLVKNLNDPPFNDVTLVCSDGQLRVNCLVLALLLPAFSRTLHIGEEALLLLPQHEVQEFRVIEVVEKKRQEKEDQEEEQE